VVLVARIADVFQISGRGVLLIALDRDTWAPDVKIRNNDKIQLRTPDSRTLGTKIVSIEFLSGAKVRNKLAVLLPADITIAQVPARTEIWLQQPS
jgi:hypothetical protein